MIYTTEPQHSMKNTGQASGYTLSWIFCLFVFPVLICPMKQRWMTSTSMSEFCFVPICFVPSSLEDSMKKNGQREVRVAWSLSTSYNWYLAMKVVATLKTQASECSGLWDQEEREELSQLLASSSLCLWAKIPEIF